MTRYSVCLLLVSQTELRSRNINTKNRQEHNQNVYDYDDFYSHHQNIFTISDCRLSEPDCRGAWLADTGVTPDMRVEAVSGGVHYSCH